MRLALPILAVCASAYGQGVSYRIVRVDTPVPIVFMPGPRPRVVVHPAKGGLAAAKPKAVKPPASR